MIMLVFIFGSNVKDLFIVFGEYNLLATLLATNSSFKIL
jgi:hypothetical protein